jgi:dGTPase
MEWNKLLNSSRPRPSTGGDSRVEFERDHDRAIFSTPVKRLQDKAQVFPLETHDAIRNRLTHSLEVSAVSRGLAIFVCKFLLEKREITQGKEREIEAIASTCGLIHDLGNPPFGHAGEYAIQEWFAKFGESELQVLLGKNQLVQDFLKFEGNAQTLRIVSKLQILADFNGLNLTLGTLSAAMKYTADSVEADEHHEDHGKMKPGFFASETSLIERVREETGIGGARNPITFLVEAADDIVYSVADVEDGIKKGVVRWIDVRKALHDTASSDLDEVLKRMERILAVSEADFSNFPDDILGSAFRTAAIWVLVEDASTVFKKQYDSLMAGTYISELLMDGERKHLAKALTDIGKARIYRTPSNLKLELMGRKIIQDLMSLFWEGAQTLQTDPMIKTRKFPGKIQALFSENYLSVFRESMKNCCDIPEPYHRLQLVTDYVCGMTDSFAKRLHAELNNG